MLPPRGTRHCKHRDLVWLAGRERENTVEHNYVRMYYRNPELEWWRTVWETGSITECDWSTTCGTSNSASLDALPTPHFTSSANPKMHQDQSPATHRTAGPLRLTRWQRKYNTFFCLAVILWLFGKCHNLCFLFVFQARVCVCVCVHVCMCLCWIY